VIWPDDGRIAVREYRQVTGCYTCEREAHLDTAADSERVWLGTHWRVAHAIGCAMPGWLVVLPRRHTTAIADHTAAEAAELGAILVASSQALHQVTGAQKTYVAQFAEAAGFAHTHFHVIPRPPDLPAEHVGPGVFWYLGRPSSEEVSPADRDELARRLRAAITAAFR
jgi:diadenosine tetraphosphate (Ap4A) HIT family hydrolase